MHSSKRISCHILRARISPQRHLQLIPKGELFRCRPIPSVPTHHLLSLPALLMIKRLKGPTKAVHITLVNKDHHPELLKLMSQHSNPLGRQKLPIPTSCHHSLSVLSRCILLSNLLGPPKLLILMTSLQCVVLVQDSIQINSHRHLKWSRRDILTSYPRGPLKPPIPTNRHLLLDVKFHSPLGQPKLPILMNRHLLLDGKFRSLPGLPKLPIPTSRHPPLDVKFRNPPGRPRLHILMRKWILESLVCQVNIDFARQGPIPSSPTLVAKPLWLKTSCVGDRTQQIIQPSHRRLQSLCTHKRIAPALCHSQRHRSREKPP